MIAGLEQWLATVPYSSVAEEFQRMLAQPPNYDMSVTNLGVLALPETFGSFRLEALYGPVVNAGNGECVTGVLTFGGQMFLTMTYRNALMNRQTAEQIVTLAQRRIEAAIWQV
jgi:hypothetical protein